ncbi:MAG: bacterial Ig-like domain-containing protein [Anaerovoracaceae bacterium]
MIFKDLKERGSGINRVSRKKSATALRIARAAILSLMLIALMLPVQPATFSADSNQIYLGFTSDVHNSITNLTTWLNKLKGSASTLDMMIFGGDYEGVDRAQQCVAAVENIYGSDTNCVLVRGNHDPDNAIFPSGLLYDGEDYAVYVMNTGAYPVSFKQAEITDLSNKLNTIDASKPVFVAAHGPIHYYSNRTTGNADNLLTVLNQHENVVFLWGHNHTVSDPYYGQVMTKGFKIKTTQNSVAKEINFTYLSYGAMAQGNNGANGLLATLTDGRDSTQIDFAYKNLSGGTVSQGTVIIGDESSPEDEEIASVSVSGITSPVAGAVPVTTATAGSSKYSAGEVSWTPSPGSSFGYDTVYTARVKVTANAGYKFTTATTATINGNAVTDKVLNSDGTLTLSYEFPKTQVAPSGPSYELAGSPESGETYLIVGKSGSNYYAMTNEKTTVSSVDYLKGVQVTVSGNYVLSTGITDGMLWDFSTSGAGFNVKNGTNFLNRKAQDSRGIYLNTKSDGKGYGDWIYTQSEKSLRTDSTQVSDKFYLKLNGSGSAYYFGNLKNELAEIYLYKLTQGPPPEDEEIASVSVSGITSPVAGAVPVTTATAGSSKYSAGEVSWTPSPGSSFGYDTVYTARVKVTANAGYKFTTATTATINGNAVTDKVLNSDGTLTLSYEFPKTQVAPSGPSYELAGSPESGETYLIVGKSGSNYYAMTNEKTTVSSVDYLKGVQVTVSGNYVLSTGITDGMLWDFSTSGAGFNVKNGTNFLNRKAQDSRGIYLNTKSDGKGYGDWIYTQSEKSLRTDSTQVSDKFYLKLNGSGSAYYFGNLKNELAEIYLYKLTQGPPPVTLETISISKQPDKTTYIEGQSFEAAGMEVTAHYNDGTSQIVTGYTIEPSGALAVSDVKITVNYEGKSADVAITVTAKELMGIAVSFNQGSTAVYPSTSLDSLKSMLTVTANYNDGSFGIVEGGDYTLSGTLSAGASTISVSYGGMTAEFTVNVTAKALETISISKQPDKTTYIEGQSFEAAGMEVTAHYNDGTSQIVTGYTIEPSGALAVSDVKITVNYEGKSADVAITVTAKELMGIAVSFNQGSTAVYPSTSLDSLKSMLTVTANYNDGSFGIVEGGEYTLSGTLSAGASTISVSYGGMTAEFTVNVTAKALETISISKQPDKTTYIEGQSFEAAGMEVTAHYNDGTSQIVTGYTIEPSGALAVSDVKITVNYEGKSADVAITVTAKELMGIAVIFNQGSTAVYPSTSLDSLKSMLTVTANYNDGSFGIVEGGEYTLSGTLSAGASTISVSYGGMTAEFTVNVTAKALETISISKQPDKTTYIEGQSFEAAGMEVTAHYNDGTSQIVTGYTIEPSGALAVSDVKITVNYEGKSADVAITVTAKELMGIAVIFNQGSTAVYPSTSLDSLKSMLTVTANYNDGSFGIVEGGEYTLSGTLSAGASTISVSYGGMTAEFTVNVTAKALETISISKQPDKTTYIEGQSFEAAGMEVTAHYNDGTSQIVTGYTIEPSGALAVSDVKITVNYEGKSADVAITVTAKELMGIAVSFNQGSTAVYPSTSLDSLKSMLTVTANYNDGSFGIVEGGEYTLSGTLSAGASTISVSYGGMTAEFTVNVTATSSGGTGGGTGGGAGGGAGGTDVTIIPNEKVPEGEIYTGFSDVPENSWYYNSIKAVTTRGLFKGLSHDYFGPDVIITRAMFVTILSRIEFGSDNEVPLSDMNFTDLSQEWYRGAIAWAYQNKITLGISETKFDPDGILTREQMAAFLYRYAEYKGYDVSYDIEALNKYTDNDLIRKYAVIPMAWSIKHNLFEGVTENTLVPEGMATRGQSATVFMRFVENFI